MLPGNILSALHYIFKQIDESDASNFCKQLSDGIDVEERQPIYFLRAELKADQRNTRKMQPLERIALICKAWNFYRQNNKKITSLKWDIIKDDFPKPM